MKIVEKKYKHFLHENIDIPIDESLSTISFNYYAVERPFSVIPDHHMYHTNLLTCYGVNADGTVFGNIVSYYCSERCSMFVDERRVV